MGFIKAVSSELEKRDAEKYKDFILTLNPEFRKEAHILQLGYGDAMWIIPNATLTTNPPTPMKAGARKAKKASNVKPTWKRTTRKVKVIEGRGKNAKTVEKQCTRTQRPVSYVYARWSLAKGNARPPMSSSNYTQANEKCNTIKT